MLTVKDSPYIKDLQFKNGEEFLKSISYGGQLYEEFRSNKIIFRGHGSEEYKLLPTALRGYLVIRDKRDFVKESHDKQLMQMSLACRELVQIVTEYWYLEQFYNICDAEGLYVPEIEGFKKSIVPGVDPYTLLSQRKWLPTGYWELAALAQHHGVPTRLLDWSRDMNVALYFACTDVADEEDERTSEMEMWALDTSVVMTEPTEFPMKIVRPRYYKNDNLTAQKGYFTFWEVDKPAFPSKNDKTTFLIKTDRTPLDKQLTDYLKKREIKPKTYLYHVTVPQSAANDIFNYIDIYGYNASSLFPGYDGAVKYIKEKQKFGRKKTKDDVTK